MIKGEKFENEIKVFLKGAGFNDVDGGRNFKINNIQVDAIGGFGSVLFVIECFSSQKRGKISIRNKLKEFKGVIKSLEEGFKEHKTYKKYSKIIFVLALKNIIPGEADKEFANSSPQVLIWDSDFLDYYTKLAKSIGEYTVYNIMGELNIPPRIEDKLILPALRCKIGEYVIYSFWVNPKQLLKYSYVARRERKEEHFYQRFIDKQRIEKMGEEYIDSGKFYPNSIIIAISEDIIERCKFTEISEWKSEVEERWPENLSFGILELPTTYRSCWIIDGQHRLYSFAKSKRYHLISVIAFEKIPKIKQADIFVDVNLNQKVVPPDLLWDLIGDLSPDEEKGIISTTVKEINKKSVLKERFYIPSFGIKRKDQLKFSGICQAILKAKLARRELTGKKINPIYADDVEKLKERLIKILDSFFKLEDKIFSEELKKEFIFTNGGIAVMIYYLERIIRYINKTPEEKDIKKFLEPLKEYLEEVYLDVKSRESLRLSCNSEGGRNSKLNEFVVNVAEKINEPNFAEGLKTPLSELEENIRKLEYELRTFIKTFLEKKDKNWMEKYLPREIVERLESDLKRKTIHDKRMEEWQFLTLGQCREIIEKNWKEFEETFRKEFDSKNELLLAIDKINKVRGPSVHGAREYLKLPKGEYELIKIYIRKIEDCIKTKG
jgi:DNA sulfur modification protein DndB